MRHLTKRSLGFPFILIAVFGSVLAQTEPRDDPSRFLANPEVQKAIEDQTPLTADPLVTKAAALVPQSAEGDDIRSAFNENANRVRLMVLLSPT